MAYTRKGWGMYSTNTSDEGGWREQVVETNKSGASSGWDLSSSNAGGWVGKVTTLLPIHNTREKFIFNGL